MSLADAPKEDWLSVLKTALSLFGNVAFTIQQSKDGKAHGRSGYAARSASDLVELGEKLHKMSKVAVADSSTNFLIAAKSTSPRESYAPATYMKLRPLNLSGRWTDGAVVCDVTHVPENGAFKLAYPRDGGTGWNLFYGGAHAANLLLVEALTLGVNSRGDQIILTVRGNNDGLALNFWNESVHAFSEMEMVRFR